MSEAKAAPAGAPAGEQGGKGRGPASQKPVSNDGFTAGLQFWVIFLVAMVLLQFPLAIAIVFGAIAGLAGGFSVGWWQDVRQLKGQEKDIIIAEPGLLAGLDTEILLEPDGEFSEDYVDPRQRRRSRYVSNRPYDIEERRRSLNSLFPWRRISSRFRN